MSPSPRATGCGLVEAWRSVCPAYRERPRRRPTRQWFPDNTVYDAMDIAGTNLMIDHVSTLYATDETISMNEVANNITVQYSNISQGQNYPQWDAEGGGSNRARLRFAAGGGRRRLKRRSASITISTPTRKAACRRCRRGGTGAYYDFRNNVFYNWLGTAGSKSGTTFSQPGQQLLSGRSWRR